MWQKYQTLPEVVRWLLLGVAMFAVNTLAALLVKAAPDSIALLYAGAGFKGAALMACVTLLAPKWGRAFGLLLLGMLLASAALYFASMQDGRISAEAFQAQALGFVLAGATLFCLRRCGAAKK